RIGTAIDDAADIIFGAVIDPSLQDQIRVTLIAAGMEELHTARIEAIHPSATRSPRAGQGQTYGPGQGLIAQSVPAVQPQSPRTPPVPPTQRIQPVQAQPMVPPQTQLPSPLPPLRSTYQEQGKGTPGANASAPGPDRQRRSLNDLRGIRSMGRRQ